jgi:hypothetical protein
MSCFERLDERQVCFLDPWAFYFGRRIRRQAKRNIGLVLQLFGDAASPWGLILTTKPRLPKVLRTSSQVSAGSDNRGCGQSEQAHGIRIDVWAPAVFIIVIGPCFQSREHKRQAES